MRAGQESAVCRVAARRPRGTVSSTDTRAALQAFQEAIATGDLQGLVDILAPDVVALSDGGGRRHVSRCAKAIR